MPGHIAIVIVNWNGKRHLERCLPSALNQAYPDFEVTVVDNASSDGSPDLVRERFPRVRLLAMTRNLGFAAGTNVGIEATEGPYVATLNADTEPEPGWLAALAAGMDARPHVGMCASKMLFMGDRTRINSTGIALDQAGIAWDRDGGRLDGEAGLAAGPVFGPSAGAALYRREMLQAVGGFDGDLFYLYEDVDLAWRARLAGWEAWYCPEARVYHVHAGAGTEGTPFKSYLLGRNRIWTILKDYPAPQLWRRLPLLLLYDVMASCYSLFRHGDIHTLRGRVAGYAAWRRIMRKRAAVQALRTAKWDELASQMAPMQAPWKVLRRYGHLSRNGFRL